MIMILTGWRYGLPNNIDDIYYLCEWGQLLDNDMLMIWSTSWWWHADDMVNFLLITWTPRRYHDDDDMDSLMT